MSSARKGARITMLDAFTFESRDDHCSFSMLDSCTVPPRDAFPGGIQVMYWLNFQRFTFSLLCHRA